MKKGRIHVGTSGWHYKHWKGTFYPEKTKDSEQLAYYLKYFRTVELNNPFYRLPTAKTFEGWRKAVPDDFIFSVKVSRFITHLKKLHETEESLATFVSNAGALKQKLGPLLFQLPPGWQINEERLGEFLKTLPRDRQCTFEFRNPTWYSNAIFKLLEKHNCAFCIYELAGHRSPEAVTADFVYIRLHGPGKGKYEGSYPDKTLEKWAEKCLGWAAEKRDVYIYFDNDQFGYAAFNALKLGAMVNAVPA